MFLICSSDEVVPSEEEDEKAALAIIVRGLCTDLFFTISIFLFCDYK
jgi:hypothetical protein